MPNIGSFSFFGPSEGVFSSHSPQIDTNPYILSLLSQKKGSKLISFQWPILVLSYLKAWKGSVALTTRVDECGPDIEWGWKGAVMKLP